MHVNDKSKKPLLGVVGPFSGPRACYGELLKDTINQSGLAEHAQILWQDDQGEGAKGQPIAISLVSQGVFAVIGHFNSDSALQASLIYNQAQIPLLLPASTAISLSHLDFIYRICPNDQQQITAIIQHLEKNQIKNLAIWMDNSNYAQRLYDLLRNNTTISCKNFSEKTAYECIVFLGAHHQIASFLLEQGNTLRTKQIICCDDCAIEEFYEEVAFQFPNMWIVTPFPYFAKCIQKAAELVCRYLTRPTHNDFHSWLNNTSLFLNNQNRDAFFNLTPFNLNPAVESTTEFKLKKTENQHD